MDISYNHKRLKQWNYLAAQQIDKTKNEQRVSSLETVEVVLD